MPAAATARRWSTSTPQWWLCTTPAKATPCSRASADRLAHRQLAGREGQTLVRVDQQRPALAPQHPGIGGAVDAAIAQMGGVLRHARQAVRAKALRFGQHQRPRGGLGHRGARRRRAAVRRRRARTPRPAAASSGNLRAAHCGIGCDITSASHSCESSPQLRCRLGSGPAAHASASSTLSAIRKLTRSLASAVTPATCGVSSRFGQSSKRGAAGSGSLLEDVDRRAAQVAGTQRCRQRRLVDDAAARGVDQHRAGLHRRDALGIEQSARRRRPAARAGSPRRHSATSSSRPTRRAPTSAKAGWSSSIIASKAMTSMPSARASRPVSWPIEPKPMRPSVLPAISRPLDKRIARPLAGRDRRRRRVGTAQQQHRRADHVLGHRQRIGAGGRDHLHAARVRRPRRRCCPARRRAGRPRAPRQRVEQRTAHLRAVAHDDRVGARGLGQQPRRVVDQLRVVQHVVRGAQPRHARARP